MTPYAIAVLIHVASGTLALATFWCAALLRKGSPLHRRCGQIYLVAMTLVVISGVPLVAKTAMAGHTAAAIFLGFLLLLVSNGCWSAWRAVRDKGNFAAYTGRVWRALNGATGVGGLGLILTAFIWWGPLSILLIAFGCVGLTIAVNAGKLLRTGPDSPRWWMKEHYGAMIGNGVATHIAFFSIGLRTAVPGLPPMVSLYMAWMLPLAVALVAAWWLNRRYGRPSAAVRPALRASGLSD